MSYQLQATAAANAVEVRRIPGADPLRDPALRRELSHRYLIWDAFVSGQRRVDVHPIVLSRRMHETAVRAAEGVVRLLASVAANAVRDPEERARYGFCDDVLRLVLASQEAGDHASFVRVDLLLDDTLTWQACEVNADCPGGHNEALGLPLLARAAGFTDGEIPGGAVDLLADRLVDLARRAHPRGGAVALVCATAYAEDVQVCALVRNAVDRRGVHALITPATALGYRQGRVFAGRYPVCVLYRYLPTEYMEGQTNILDLEQAVRSGALRTISSFSQMFLQSKLLFARAWAKHDRLDQEARNDAAWTHVPESYEVSEIPTEELAQGSRHWVIKRALGRVGDEVFVGPLFGQREWSEIVDNVHSLARDKQRWIAQRFVPQTPLATPWGPRFITLGCYLLDGRFAGYFARLSRDSHVSHDALVLPVFCQSGA